MIPTLERRAEFTAGLRAMADFIDTLNPNVPMSVELTQEASVNYETIRDVGTGASFPGNSLEGVAILASWLGSFDKVVTNDFFNIIKNFGGGVRMGWWTSRDAVCRPKVVGHRIIPAQPEKTVAAEPEKTVEIIEWECPSLKQAIPASVGQNPAPQGSISPSTASEALRLPSSTPETAEDASSDLPF